MNQVIVFLVSIVISGVVLTSLYTSVEETGTQSGIELLKTGNCTVDGEMECWCLPTPGYMDVYETPPLLTLLQMGDKEQKVVEGSSAVFLLGQTGAGVTTSTHVISGNLSKLRSAYFPPSDELVIIDEEDKIGHPSLYSTCSKHFFREGPFKCFTTTFPELVKNEENFFDFPSLSEVHSKAVNFFMGEAVKNITEFKLLFIVPQTLLKEENTELFDRFVTSAIKFVNDIFKFKNSFGLVVTKVNGFTPRGNYIKDLDVIAKITGFLQVYEAPLVEKLQELEKDEKTLLEESEGGSYLEWRRNSNKREKENVLKKLVFVQPLLFQDEKGNYSRIWFIRRPIECGSLNEMEIMHQTRSNITEMCKRLEPAVINKPLEEPVFNVVFQDVEVLKILNDSDWRSRTVTPDYHTTEPYNSSDLP